MTKSLITGCNGLAGKWLTTTLTVHNCEVYGIDLQDKPHNRLTAYSKVDINDKQELSRLISALQPDFIFNLAGVTFLPNADKTPGIAFASNISGVITILDTVKNHSPQSSVLLVGSSKEYGTPQNDDPILESTVPAPANFYGISKYAGELIGMQYHRQFGLDVRCARSFNHTGPGQSPLFVCSDWAKQVAGIALGNNDPVINIGNSNLAIDFSDVRDIVEGYRLILSSGKPGEIYNVCSGNATPLGWILSYLIQKTSKPIEIIQSNNKIRQGEPKDTIVGSSEKLQQHTGWKPLFNFEQTLDDLYSWWIEELTKTP